MEKIVQKNEKLTFLHEFKKSFSEIEKWMKIELDYVKLFDISNINNATV